MEMEDGERLLFLQEVSVSPVSTEFQDNGEGRAKKRKRKKSMVMAVPFEVNGEGRAKERNRKKSMVMAVPFAEFEDNGKDRAGNSHQSAGSPAYSGSKGAGGPPVLLPLRLAWLAWA
ncbi:hypothetical protein ACOMHN_035290 [Nucella lapillus]